jgi:NAD(P)-dependent dehydrogenase (short-subunit alcohol dehydrogenase family)/nitroimidazol reductase NimA-like FMN-containing flavoprotein (pyridoxamine 5'-phosphate oxidase superfamily)
MSKSGDKYMRRKQSEITDPKEIQRILAATPIGRLATTGSDGYPYITPVNFVFYQDCIYFHCAPQGEKLCNLERDPRVCFTVDIPLAYLDGGFDPNGCIKALHQFYHCVIIRGEAQVVPNGPLKLAALNALVTKTEGSAEHEPINAEMAGYKACKVVEIKPTSISAKSELHQSKPRETRAAVARYLAARNRPGDMETVQAMGVSVESDEEDIKPWRMPADFDFARLAPAAGTRMLIVGGCGAIGRSLVSACLAMDIEVALFALPRSIEAYPPPEGALAIAVDAADEESVQKGFEALGRHWESIDTLVFLVGFLTVPPRQISELDAAEWDVVVAGNLRSAYLVNRAALPMLRASGNGAIVNVGSSLAYNPLKGVSAYASAKAGLVALTKSLAMENAPQIRANLVAPSAIDTRFLAGGGGPRGEAADKAGGDDWFRKMKDAYIPTIPMNRIAQPQDIVGSILFLAGKGASFITGQVLHVNGGRVTP